MQESPIFEHLRVMVIEEMIYLIHVGGLAEHVRLSLSSEAQLLFVDLEHDPPKVGSFCRLLVSVVLTFTLRHAPLLLFGEGSFFIFVPDDTSRKKPNRNAACINSEVFLFVVSSRWNER
jgi:hypothetical protein